MRQFSTFNLQLSTIAATLLLLCSCEYKDLCYDHPHGKDFDIELVLNLNLDMKYDIDVDDETHTKINAPEYMKVDFYDPSNNTLNKYEFVKDGRGPIHVASGVYNMVAYSFGTEWTRIRGEGDYTTLEAFTSDITEQKSGELSKFYTRSDDSDVPQGPIIYTPDHLLVANMQVEIPMYVPSGIFTITGDASTIIETYEIDLTNVTGQKNISSIECFVTNQALSNFFGRRERNNTPATIYFTAEVGTPNDNEFVHTAFNTFGKLPGESRAFLHILLKNASGVEVLITKDITKQFTDPTHHIVIDDPVVVPDPKEGGAGIAPTVDPWEEEFHDVPIG